MLDFQRLYDASKQNQSPDQFLKIFKDFQKTFRQEDMRKIFDSLPASLRGKFWSNIAKMAIVAKKVEDKTMENKSIQEWFNHLDDNPGKIKSEAGKALIDIADGTTITEKTNNS